MQRLEMLVEKAYSGIKGNFDWPNAFDDAGLTIVSGSITLMFARSSEASWIHDQSTRMCK